MKLWGCILVFASGAGLGLWGSRLLKRRVEELGETAFFLSFISQELESTLAPVNVLIERAVRQGSLAGSRLVTALWDSLQQAGDAPFSQVFSRAVKRYRGALNEGDLQALEPLGEGLGQYSASVQMEILQRTASNVERREREARQAWQEKGKLFRMLGVFSGAAVCLVIL